MRQIYDALLKAQQQIGNNCSIEVSLEPAMYHHPNMVVTCWRPDNQLRYQLSYTYDYIDKFYGDPLRIFVEQARIAYEKEMGE